MQLHCIAFPDYYQQICLLMGEEGGEAGEWNKNTLVGGRGSDMNKPPKYCVLVCEPCRCYKCIELFLVNDKTICANCLAKCSCSASFATYSTWATCSCFLVLVLAGDGRWDVEVLCWQVRDKSSQICLLNIASTQDHQQQW